MSRIRVKVYPSAPEELILRVLEMPEHWRGLCVEMRDGAYAANFTNPPSLHHNGHTICLCGEYTEDDSQIFGWPYPTAEARNEALAAFTRIIRRMNWTEGAEGMVHGTPRGPHWWRTKTDCSWCSTSGTLAGWHLPTTVPPDFTKPLPALPKAWNDPAPTTSDGTVIE